MARTKALPMMHHHSRKVIEEVLGARRAGAAGTGAGHNFGRGLPAAVGLHVEKLVEANVDSDLLPVVPPRPPEHRRPKALITQPRGRALVGINVDEERGIIIPEAFEVKPQDLRKFVDHQLLLRFGQED